MLLVFISVFPVIVILLYIYFRDKYEKEPISLLLKAFVGGLFSALATILLLSPLHSFFPELRQTLIHVLICNDNAILWQVRCQRALALHGFRAEKRREIKLNAR